MNIDKSKWKFSDIPGHREISKPPISKQTRAKVEELLSKEEQK